MLKVSLNNSGGELDSETVDAPEDAAEEAIRMIREAGILEHGDKILVVEIE